MKHIIRTVALVLVVSMLSVAAFAAGTTPSVEQKPAPKPVPPTTEVDGKPAIVVKDKDGKVMESDDPEVLTITPMADAKDQAPEVKKEMEDAYTEIAEAESLVAVAPALTDVMKDMEIETPAEDLVVRDIVKLDVSEKMAEALKEEGNTLDITFEMELEEGQKLIVMVKGPDGEWIVIPAENVVVNDDGTVTVGFTAVGVVAFVVA